MNRKQVRERAELMLAYSGGAEIEYLDCLGKWCGIDQPSFDSRHTYRIAVTKDSVDWSHVDDSIVAMARDEDDEAAWLHKEVPVIEQGEPFWSGGECVSAEYFKSYKRGTCDWRDSLVLRPEEEK